MNALALIEPLTPADCDLSGLDWMPLDVVRLRDSSLANTEDPEAFRCAVILWCIAWHQVPAASLADDDRDLAQKAGLGRDVRRWREIKEEALRGFQKCSDGRLYHRVIAEKALETWVERLGYRRRSAKGNGSRYGRNLSPEAFDAKILEAKTRLEALRRGGSSLRAPTRSGEGLLHGSEGDRDRDSNSEKKTPPLRGGAKETRPAGSPPLPKAKPEPKAPRKPKAGEGHRLPVGWYADAENRQYAILLGFDAAEIDDLEEEFRLWWPAQPGAKGRKTDWSLTWKSWVRRERKDRDQKQRAGARGRGPQSTDRLGALHRGGLAAADSRAREQPKGGRSD